jgi:hypothetical protein
MKKLSKGFYLSAVAISVIGGILFIIGYASMFYLMISAMRGGDSSATLGTAAGAGTLLFVVVGGIALLYGSIVLLVLVYRMWQSIQDGHARTTPGKAVGFLFIPFFNLYWMFQAFWGFSKDYNSHVERNQLGVAKLPEGLFLTWNILSFFTWVPILGVIAYWVVLFMCVSKICDAVNVLPAVAGAGSTAQPPLPSADWTPAGRLSLHCVSGEFMNDTVDVPSAGLYIGRDPSKANLVLSSPEVSGVHAYVRPEGGQVSLEDWNSLNGTYYRSDALSQWVQLKGKVVLSRGARFRLGDNVVEFEIRT